MPSLVRFRCSFVLASGGGLLSLLAAWLASLDHAGGGVLDVLLRGGADHEAGLVNHLLANGDVSAADQDASVMDRGSQLALDDEGLQASLHELSDRKSQHVIELALRLLEETKSNHASDDGLTCKNEKL